MRVSTHTTHHRGCTASRSNLHSTVHPAMPPWLQVGVVSRAEIVVVCHVMVCQELPRSCLAAHALRFELLESRLLDDALQVCVHGRGEGSWRESRQREHLFVAEAAWQLCQLEACQSNVMARQGRTDCGGVGVCGLGAGDHSLPSPATPDGSNWELLGRRPPPLPSPPLAPPPPPPPARRSNQCGAA